LRHGLPITPRTKQIAYGAGARVLALLAVSAAAHSSGLRQLAGIAAGWFFGQDPAGIATYNPATGATDDGINANGTVNLNSGAESTIFGCSPWSNAGELRRFPQVVALSGDSSGRPGRCVPFW
jgi:hypothetical protein